MVDLREKVVEDRGLISKIQSIIPGFSGYRAREDLRAADNMLRMQMADRIAGARKGLEGCRAVLVDSMSLEHLDRLGALINKFKATEGEVRHAEQGYSGISAKIQVKEDEINKLYEYDYAQVSTIVEIENEVLKLKSVVDSGDSAGIKAGIANVDTKLNEFRETFRKRMILITNTEA
ncbi:hypothetical protein CUJ83_13830 [Methanocella sp. CWC-04]|uniref:Uncharacterized protein n=1 Tax=Methanooceanicella nereidis TaxID=2052831 RepID=A0AAP2REW8_9EURY|nr:hypothetical protein [Methanocella sp. CWC-04]MCD1296078.1 hypothetical protein [Methanocella sp. CWC-04]